MHGGALSGQERPATDGIDGKEERIMKIGMVTRQAGRGARIHPKLLMGNVSNATAKTEDGRQVLGPKFKFLFKCF